MNNEQLKQELIAVNNLLEFVTNKYERQLQGLKAGLIAKFRKDMQMEIEGIAAVANTLPQEQGESLRRWITNVTQLLNTY